MKKTLLLLASAAMLLVGCAKEKFSPEAGDAEMVNMTVSALVQGEELTRAAVDEDGKGVNANRCIMVLYYGGQVYGRYQADVSEYKATFDVKVPAKRTYKAVFWADCAAEDGGDLYYNTADLTNITLKSDYVGNNDKRDAFFKCEEYTVENKSQSFTATLTRPFAQINVISKDIQVLRLAALYPQKVNLSFSAATSFNAMSGECGAAEAIAYEADVYKAYDSTKEQLTLSMDYLFAGDRSAVDIDFKAPTEGELKVEHNFSNIPYQRNYRTNIVGNLLTADAHWDVTINHNWNEPDEEVKFVEAGSVAAANEAFANGATSVKITSVGEETTLYLPQTTEEVTIDFANPDKDVTVKYGSTLTKAAGDKPAAVNIATNDVTKFVVSGISNVVWLAGNQAALANALANATNKQVVALSNDITMSGEWVPVISTKEKDGHFCGTFDGRNHTISNMKVTDYSGGYIGFISHISGATIKNVTFKDAELTNAESLGGNARGAVIVGWSYACNIDNCHVINSSVTGCQKVAGILGSMSVEGSAGLNSVTNCSVEGLTISCNIVNDLFQSGALVGYIQLINTNPDGILIENNSVKDITFNDDCSDYGNVSYYNGTFIGTIDRKQKVADQKIILKNNIISGTNTELFKTVYSSTYFGWTTNPESYTGAIAPIIIDGVEWTPNYPIKNENTGVKYPTLAKAVAAASAGDVIKITEAGTYTVPSISKNITVAGEGDVDENGVVFNCVGSGSIASISNGATFQNVTMNFGQSGYHGFQSAGHIVMTECVLNGLFFSYGDMTFNDCTFNQDAEEYNMWTYGGDIVYNGCTFNSKGKFLNIYRESAIEYDILAKDCVFNTSGEEPNKAALNIKETCKAIFLKYNVTVENCSCNELQNTLENKDDGTLYRVSPIWQVDDRKTGETGINVTIDGSKVYPFCSKDADGNYHIVNAAGLLQFHDLYAAGKVAYTAKVYVDNDIDFTGKTWTALDWHADGALKGFALFDGQNHTIKNFTVSGQGMFSRWACTSNIGATPYFKDIVFDGAKNVTSTLNVSLFCGQTYQNAKIENVTIKNSQFEGTKKVAPFVGTVYDENATGPTLTLKDCKVENTTVRGTSLDFDICGMVAWVYEKNNDKVAFEGNNVVKDVTLYIPAVTCNMCAKIYHNGETAYDEAANVTVNNVNVVIAQ